MFPDFPALKDFLAFWVKFLESPLFAVTVAHSKLIKPAELRAIDGVIRGNISAKARKGHTFKSWSGAPEKRVPSVRD
jgi:hypothetical protein